MKRKILRKKEVRELNEKIQKYEFSFDKKDILEHMEDESGKYIKRNHQVMFVYLDEKIVPALALVLSGEAKLKTIVVDMGAVKFVVNGADIMRPGIVEIEEDISVGEIIKIVDINNRKPLAIGAALYGSEDMKNLEKGKAIRNLHYVGDAIWKMSIPNES